MRKQWSMGGLAATFGLAAVLTASLLAGCGRTQEPAADDKAETPQVVVQDQAAGDEETEVEADAPEAGAEATDDEQAVGDGDAFLTVTEGAIGDVETGAFTFLVPQYWAGRVDVAVDAEGYGPIAKVYLSGNPDALLATLALEEGDEAQVAGDVATHLVGSIADGAGSHVEVWTTNWPWLVAEGEADEGLSEDELALLVDLSSGGQFTYDDARTMASDELVSAEPDFMSSTLVPTVAFG